ncbi:MAG: hypothetical protein RIQ33_1759 [Bacteroidota bacterium]|jgi:hypothetical protein
MSFKYNPGTLKKLEGILEEARFIVRYEKGNFNAGHCLLEDKRIVVINKFFTLENKINCLIDIINMVNIGDTQFSEDLLPFYKKITSLKVDNEAA